MRKILLTLTAVLVLSACGRSICIGPFGNKDECYGSGTQSDATTGVLRIATPTGINPSLITKGSSVTLTAQGGAGSYRWRLISGKGTLAVGTGGTQSGSYFIGGTVIFTDAEPNDTNRVELEDVNHSPVPITLVTGP